MNRFWLVAPMLAFGTIGIGLWIFYLDTSFSGPFHDDLVPELVVFCSRGFYPDRPADADSAFAVSIPAGASYG